MNKPQHNGQQVRATAPTVGHAPMGEYCLCFHPGEPTHCWCPPRPLQTRDHILCVCLRVTQEEDHEPPFSQVEVLEFCQLNYWVFDFPPLEGWEPDWAGCMVWPASRRMGRGVLGVSGLSTGCYGPLCVFMVNQHHLVQAGRHLWLGVCLLLGLSTLSNFRFGRSLWWNDTIENRLHLVHLTFVAWLCVDLCALLTGRSAAIW